MKIQDIELTDKHKGKSVIYIPTYANGNIDHKDVKAGIISSWTDSVVFVKYYSTYGLESYAKATIPNDLIWEKEVSISK